jgi:hypothetical protein
MAVDGGSLFLVAIVVECREYGGGRLRVDLLLSPGEFKSTRTSSGSCSFVSHEGLSDSPFSNNDRNSSMTNVKRSGTSIHRCMRPRSTNVGFVRMVKK